jgi:chorismate lyase
LSVKSHLLHSAPQWKNTLPAVSTQQAALKGWLQESGSLTKRLRSCYDGQISVEILFQAWKPAFIDECRILALQSQRFHLIREVVLHHKGQPLVLARTVMPQTTIDIAHRNLSHLGTRPLGEVLFAYPDLELRQRQYSRVNSQQWNLDIVNKMQLDNQPSIFGRRSVYAIHQHTLLVAEFFLPAVYQPE